MRKNIKGDNMNSNAQSAIPNDDDYALVNLIFQKKQLKPEAINTNSLTISSLHLISKERIKIDLNEEISSLKLNNNHLFKSKGRLEKELEIMSNIRFTINSKNMKKLNQKDQIILNMFKDINKSHEFDLKSMYEKMLNKEVAIRFSKHFNDYEKSVRRENKFSDDGYKDIIEKGLFTLKGNQSYKEWKDFKKQLKSKDTYSKIDDESKGILDKYLIYGRCFEIEENMLKNIKSTNPDYDTDLFNFLSIGGADLLKIIFDKGIQNSKIERKGDGSVPIGNSKYFVPGFG